MSINLRFKAVIDREFRGNKRAFATLIGVSPTVIENVVGTRQGKPSYDVLEKVCANANVNPEWLLTGEGPMLRADERSDSSIPVATHASEPGEGIPLLPIDAMAGALTSEQTVLEYECERYVVPVFSGADFLIPVNGTSMVPTYHPGDIVACKRVPMSGLFFQWGKIYVIDTTQGPLIKRIKPSADPQHITIVSDNTAFDPFQLPTADIRAVALVIGVIRLE